MIDAKLFDATYPVWRPPQIRSYADLQEQMHRDLLAQNPDWIDADGRCAKCDDYDRRLAELISIFQQAAA